MDASHPNLHTWKRGRYNQRIFEMDVHPEPPAGSSLLVLAGTGNRGFRGDGGPKPRNPASMFGQDRRPEIIRTSRG